MTTTRGLAWPSTAGANIGVDRAASDSVVNVRRERLMTSPPLRFLGSSKIRRERGNLIILEPAGDGLHHLVRQTLVAIGLKPLVDQAFRLAEDVRNRRIRFAGAVTGR